MANELNSKDKLYSIQIVLDNESVILNNENVISCFFIEDIYKMCMVGKLVFNDVYGLLEFGPFTGNEEIVITYGVDNDKQSVFEIWKVGAISQSNTFSPTSKSQIEVYFVDPTFSSCILRKYSRSWVDTKITDIMKYFITNMLNISTPLNIEKSTNSIDFVCPYWTPLQSFRYLANKAKGSKSGTSGYLVYNNTENDGFTTNIKTLNYLFDDLDKSIESDFYKFESDSVSTYNKIIEWWISGIDKTSHKGIKGGTWRGYDINTKSLLSKEFKYSDGINNSVLLGKNSLYVDIDDERTINRFLGENSLEDLELAIYAKWVKKYSVQNALNIIVDGHEKRYAGKQIEIIWPSISAEEKFNKGFGGKYLIKTVTHDFRLGKYKQRLVLLKNAYNNLDTNTLVPAVKTNTYTNKQSIGKS